MAMLEIAVISIFPDMFKALDVSITGRAKQAGIIDIKVINPRDFADNKHGQVDDRPYGGGPGMVMMAQPLSAAINYAKQTLGNEAKVIYLSPQGKNFDYTAAKQFTRQPKMILLAGRYEGIDERVVSSLVDEEWSIGDFVLTGGELAAMVMIDAVTRLLPGALGDEDSAQQDSFCDGLLDYPHYTRPEVFNGQEVPKVLLSGDHQKIKQWRQQQALLRTRDRRPELLTDIAPEKQAMLAKLTNRESDTSTEK